MRTENTCLDLTRRRALTPCVVETELQLICLETGGGDKVTETRSVGLDPSLERGTNEGNKRRVRAPKFLKLT